MEPKPDKLKAFIDANRSLHVDSDKSLEALRRFTQNEKGYLRLTGHLMPTELFAILWRRVQTPRIRTAS
jgi:hypothetical protein